MMNELEVDRSHRAQAFGSAPPASCRGGAGQAHRAPPGRALRRAVAALLALGLTWGLAGAVRAQDQTDPRDYEAETALPNRTMVAVIYYRHVSASGSQDYSQELGILRAAYIMRFGHWSVVPFDAILPVADVTAYTPAAAGSPADVALHASGIGDFQFLPTVGYLRPEGAFNHTYIAFTPYFSFPTGQYDVSHPVNVSTHRYWFEQELAIGQRFLKVMNVEVMGNVTEYTDNDKFAATTPLGTLQGSLTHRVSGGFVAHLSMDVAAHVYVAVSYYLAVNGQQNFTDKPLAIDMKAIDQQTVQTLRFGVGIRVDPQTVILAQYNQDVAATGAAGISRFIGLRVSHFW
jgi:hypothetical protein